MMSRLSMLWHYAQARRRFTRWRSRAALEAWQEEQVQKHLARVAERSPYFGEMARQHGIPNWREWPLSGKVEMMRHFDRWNTAGIRLEEAWALATSAEESRDFTGTLHGITVGLSSGTSGSRGVFLANAAERQEWTGTLLARVLRGTLLQEHRAALFLRADSPLYQTIGSRRFRFEFFDLLQPLEEHWPRLRALRPTILAAPPHALHRMAGYEGAAESLAPAAILLSVADVLEESDRMRIEQGFQMRVGQIYQATEGFLAATCPQGRLHWNEDVLIVQKQWLDEARTRYTPIVTDFRRRTQPIIRHRLGDVIVEDHGPPCACGSLFATLGSIEGRCDDVLRLPALSAEGEVTLFPDFVRRSIMLSVPTGVEYVVTQISLTRWHLSFSEPCDFSRVRQEITALCERIGARVPELSMVEWTAPRPDAKRRRVRCQIPEPSAS